MLRAQERSWAGLHLAIFVYTFSSLQLDDTSVTLYKIQGGNDTELVPDQPETNNSLTSGAPEIEVDLEKHDDHNALVSYIQLL